MRTQNFVCYIVCCINTAIYAILLSQRWILLELFFVFSLGQTGTDDANTTATIKLKEEFNCVSSNMEQFYYNKTHTKKNSTPLIIICHYTKNTENKNIPKQIGEVSNVTQ